MALYPPLSSLRVAGREALAFARLATLLPRDWTPVRPLAARRGDDVVVLLHGLLATAGALRPLRERVAAGANAHVASFTYEPGPGVEEVAQRLDAFIGDIAEDVRVHLVGHSLGGVVIRWYVDVLGGDRRVVQTISLASPFAGARRARFLPGQASTDIMPDSAVLQRLGGAVSSVPHLSISASDDALAGVEAALAHGARLLIPNCGHNGLLYDQRAADAVVDRVLSLRRIE